MKLLEGVDQLMPYNDREQIGKSEDDEVINVNSTSSLLALAGEQPMNYQNIEKDGLDSAPNTY